jgi:hypothetical protein
MNKYYFIAVFSDSATTQRNTPNILLHHKKHNMGKKLEEHEDTQMYEHCTTYNYTHNLN